MTTPTLPILLLAQDFFWRAKVEATARASGMTVRCVADGSLLSAEERFSGCIVDLESAGSGSMRALSAIAGRQPTVAFGSHVRADLAQLAREAGCHAVLPRSALVAGLPDLLRRWSEAPA